MYSSIGIKKQINMVFGFGLFFFGPFAVLQDLTLETCLRQSRSLAISEQKDMSLCLCLV